MRTDGVRVERKDDLADYFSPEVLRAQQAYIEALEAGELDSFGGAEPSPAQTFRERGCEWRVFVDPFGTELYTVLAASPTLDVVGGGLHRLVAIAPTTVRAGEPFEALVKAEDLWGNPCERFDGEVTRT